MGELDENNAATGAGAAAGINDDFNGAFGQSLLRNNKQIKQDRALAIVENTRLLYRRRIEDLEIVIKNLERERTQSIDLSPSHVGTLIPVNDFDAEQFIANDIKNSIRIRDLNIELQIAKERLSHLFNIKL